MRLTGYSGKLGESIHTFTLGFTQQKEGTKVTCVCLISKVPYPNMYVYPSSSKKDTDYIFLFHRFHL